MNDLGLPAFGREPAFAADEVAYDVVVRSALGRRRTRAVAGTASTAAMAFLAVVVLGGAGGAGRASVEPADTFPAATRSATASPASGPAPSLPAAVSSALPSAFPHVFPTPSPTPEPSATDRPRPTGEPSPTAAAADQEITPQWSESVVIVKDRPQETCTQLDATDGWCFRYLGPTSVAAGAKVSFVSELCRITTARTAGRVDFEDDPELSIALQGPAGSTREDEQFAISYFPFAPRQHSRHVAVGACLRWTNDWTGLDVRGRPMAAGTYKFLLMVDGEARNAGDPPSNDGADLYWYVQDEFPVT